MTISPSSARPRLVSTVVRPFRAAVALLPLFAAGLGGCVPFGDPAGPAAEGTISLGAGVETEGFKTLDLLTLPASDADFDPEAPSFPDGDGLTGEYDLTGVTFPFGYITDGGLGTTTHKRWRLFAWLSKGDERRPVSGEPYGTVIYEVEYCGIKYGDYCGVTSGVDLTIDLIVP